MLFLILRSVSERKAKYAIPNKATRIHTEVTETNIVLPIPFNPPTRSIHLNLTTDNTVGTSKEHSDDRKLKIDINKHKGLFVQEEKIA